MNVTKKVYSHTSVFTCRGDKAVSSNISGPILYPLDFIASQKKEREATTLRGWNDYERKCNGANISSDHVNTVTGFSSQARAFGDFYGYQHYTLLSE